MCQYLCTVQIWFGEIIITIFHVQLQTAYLLIADFKEGLMNKSRAQIGVCPFALLPLQKSENVHCKPSEQHFLTENMILMKLRALEF